MTTPIEGFARAWAERAWNGTLSEGEQALREMLAPDCELAGTGGDIGTLVGPDEYRPYWLLLRQAFPDLRCDVVRVEPDASGASGSVEFRFRGTHQAEFLGMPATGASIDVTGTSVIAQQDGRAQRVETRWDVDDLLKQLGHEVPSVERAARDAMP